LTTGIPLVTYRLPAGGDATMHPFIDGGSPGLGSTESEWVQAGRYPWFGSVKSLLAPPGRPDPQRADTATFLRSRFAQSNGTAAGNSAGATEPMRPAAPALWP
jgi:hypothetical protein